MTGASTEATPAMSFVFQPPAGGDLTLRSCDGTTFLVHSLILSLASTVFSGMVTGATKSTIVELAEDAEAISLMLAFIYPVDPPKIATVDQLEKIMALSQKYDIEKLIKYIEKHDCWSQIVISNPIRAFRTSVKHAFPATRALSAKAFGLKRCNYRSPDGLEELARLFPESAYLIGLIGAQFVRDEIFKDIYTTDEVRPKYDESRFTSHSSYMACRGCWEKGGRSMGVYTPGWLLCWVKKLHNRLVDDPLDPCEDLFGFGCIVGTSGCSACVTQTLTKRALFESWARETKSYVDKKLEVLDKLYLL